MNARPLGEFDLIEKFFTPLTSGERGAMGLKDDAALLPPLSHGQAWIVTTDMMIEGRHWLAGSDPADVAGKLLAVNLSDLAAMGARPRFYTLALALKEDVDEAWIAAFAAGLGAAQKRHDITLVGGDTTATSGPVTASITAFGDVARGMELRRAGAAEGNGVFVTGTIGDAALGLRVLEGRLAGLDPVAERHLVKRHRLPEPRTLTGPMLCDVASACIDVSDGLVQDLGHVAMASRVSIRIEAGALPLSPAARAAIAADPSLLETVLSGGDDYELAFAAPEAAAGELESIADRTGIPITRIGTVGKAGARPVSVAAPDGRDVTPKKGGFSHF